MKAPAKKSSAPKKPAPAAKKPATKAKATAKPAPKKVAAKAAAKPVSAKAKPTAPAAARKAVAKPAVKKPIAKPASSPTKPPKGVTKPSAKAPAKHARSTPAPAPKAVPKTQPVTAPKPITKADAKLESKLAPKPPAIQPPAPSGKVKSGPSAKTYHAGFSQDWAPAPLSGAAKASFTMSSPVFAPPSPTVIKKDPKLANNWKAKKPEQLTDAEVIAMPDTEYMNDKQLAFFRLRLVQIKAGILASADETTEHLREDTSIVPDPADRATIEEEHALELRTRDRERKLLKKIEQAIGRIDKDEYGYCDETGEPIGVARLIARPTATLSLEAQQRRELKQKMFGD